jgi:DnaJ-class molecular chaperone
MIAGKICEGTNVNATLAADWAECPSCAATGLKGDKTCGQCDGFGWLFARR